MDVKSERGNWITGIVEVKNNEFEFSAKVFENPSEGYGINEHAGDGHISKLEVTHLDSIEGDEKVLRYDREWEFNYIPKTSKEIVRKIESHVKNK